MPMADITQRRMRYKDVNCIGYGQKIDVVLYRTCSVRTAEYHLQGHDNQDLNLGSKRVFTLSGTFPFRIS